MGAVTNYRQQHNVLPQLEMEKAFILGNPGRAGSEVGSGEGTAEESPSAGRETDETDCFRLADNPELGCSPSR
jgi:hypothetical protein